MESHLGKNLAITEVKKKKKGAEKSSYVRDAHCVIVCINTYSLRRLGWDLIRDNDVQGKWIRYRIQAQAVNIELTGSNVAAFI